MTGRRRLWDEPPYETLNYGTEGLTGQASLRDGQALTGRLSLRDSSLRDGGAYGTSLLTRLLMTARRRSITGGAFGTSPPKYGTEALTGRLSLRDSSLRDGGAYRRLRDDPPYRTLTAGQKRLRDELLTGRTFRQLRRPSL